MTTSPIGLDRLEAQIASDLARVAYPDKPWVQAADVPAGTLDCAIVGGGQFGLALAFALRREKVDSVVFDAGPAGYEGPWETFARMEMLRTPKELTGPDLGIPSLTFRAWFEAQRGAEAWSALERIARKDWMDYLRWYRAVLAIDMRNGMTLTKISPRRDDLFELTFACEDGDRIVSARTIILATGAEGSGGRVVPAFLAETLPPHLYAHTNDAPDPSAMRGKRIGILGAGASAFDYAAAALEAGAAEAHLFFRRDKLPLQNPRRWMENAGYLRHYPDLPDAHRWSYMHGLATISQPPPRPTFERAARQPQFRLHPGTPWTSVAVKDDAAVDVETRKGRFTFDFIIAATGMVVDLALRPELDGIVADIALWGDRYTPPPNLTSATLARFPYLGAYGEFQPREPGRAPWLSRIFTITRGATLSLGPVAASNSNMKYTVPRIVAGVTRTLFLDAADRLLATFQTATFDELDAARVDGMVRG